MKKTAPKGKVTKKAAPATKPYAKPSVKSEKATEKYALQGSGQCGPGETPDQECVRGY